jgi:hypothetical protein
LTGGLLRHVAWYKFIDISDVLSASIIWVIRALMEAASTYTAQQPRAVIALIMETASTYETSANFYQIKRRDNPENSQFDFLHCVNVRLKLVFREVEFKVLA